MDEFTGDYLDHLKLFIDDRFVILDDIGSQGHTRFREEVLFNALDMRYNGHHPTLITSNLTPVQIKNTYHHRVYDRLFANDNLVLQMYPHAYRGSEWVSSNMD